MNLLEGTMNEVTSKLLDSPLKTYAVTLTVASLGYLAIQKIFLSNHSSNPYPPGPPRQPVIGAIRAFPKGNLYQGWVEWAKLYGDIVYAPLPGVSLLILNSHEVAQELLSKRPNSTAGRSVGYIITDLMSFKWSTSFIQPGPSHSNQRKMLRRGIGPQRVGSYDPSIEFEVAKLMANLETFEGSSFSIIQDTLGRLVSKLTYGEKIWDEMGEGLSHWNLEALALINEAFFGPWPVEIFHFLRFIPDWVPGLRFKYLSREGKRLSHLLRYRAYKRGVELYKSGTLGHCILNDLLEEFGESEDVQDATAVLYGAGSDTTNGAINGVLHALFLFPDVSQRVFEEIQSVTHGLRLPTISDRSKLPYTEAVFKEATRIRPFMALGLPHVNNQDEIIKGYLIPKGTVINLCLGYMLNDPKIWGDPEVFRPERFLEPDAAQRPNPFTVLFGYGTRVCPGMYLADRLAFHMVVTINSLFQLTPLKGEERPDLKSIVWTDEGMKARKEFKCRFVVRDEKARQLLKTASFHA
ncbi:cytochrome P450 [Serendipita vermifera]|nr:cytochrome P450 [Serendipita vermifera]